MALPNELEKRQRIKKDLERCVAILNERDLLDSDLDDIANVLQDEEVMKAKDFKALVKAKYEGDKLLLKAKDTLAKVESDISEVDILDNLKG
jgi:hypothetical protein